MNININIDDYYHLFVYLGKNGDYIMLYVL